MRVYQTIHKYRPHIPLFEARHGITDDSILSFAELQALIIQDGYAAAYILEPALHGKTDEVFYTIWDYERLQFLWAKEHGLNTTDLNLIKKAQIDWFKPDVFYNMSAFRDDQFIQRYPLPKNVLKVSWFGVVQAWPEMHEDYDIRLTLHKPYLEIWKQKKLTSYEMQPSFCDYWDSLRKPEPQIDFMAYGQCVSGFFSHRNAIFEEMLKHHDEYDMQFYLQYKEEFAPLINVKFLRRITRRRVFPTPNIEKYAREPLYGSTLYEKVANSKYTVNAYGNFNTYFKSNMRLFEAIGCGSILLSENGPYPDGFVEGENYIGYDTVDQLIKRLPELQANYPHLRKEMEPHMDRVRKQYSKHNQWLRFCEVVQKQIV